ncbi:MAG: Rrf2 family transcriptional regulator [Thermomicrobiales bacterium]|nr:Rrf2 family transcriptional regulator [Thermomicrobiales bacterium]
MKVSSRGEYGVRAMVALAKNHGQGPMSIAAMSKASAIPMSYLEQLIGPLRRAGLVKSTRGARGGYTLTRDPSEVRVGEVYRIMEGPVAPMDCVSEDLTDQTCPLIEGCETRPVWLRVRDAIVTTLDSTTLGDLVAQSPNNRPGADAPAAAPAHSDAASPD